MQFRNHECMRMLLRVTTVDLHFSTCMFNNKIFKLKQIILLCNQKLKCDNHVVIDKLSKFLSPLTNQRQKSRSAYHGIESRLGLIEYLNHTKTSIYSLHKPYDSVKGFTDTLSQMLYHR